MTLLIVIQQTLTPEQADSRLFFGCMLFLAAAGCWLLNLVFQCDDHLASPESIADQSGPRSSQSVTDHPDSFFSPHV